MSRIAIITGAARGIGAAAASRLVDDGWRVVLIDRDELVEETAEALGPQASAHRGDVASPADWERIISAVHDELGPVDCLVSNALATDRTPIDRMAPESWQRQLDVNLTGAFHAVRACLPDLRASGHGSIVMVSSVHASFGLPDVPAYATTKAGLTGLTRQLAAQYGAEVRVNCVLPGPILTAQWDHTDEPSGRRARGPRHWDGLGRPEEVAEAIAFLAGEGASFITGASLAVDGGWSITKGSS